MSSQFSIFSLNNTIFDKPDISNEIRNYQNLLSPYLFAVPQQYLEKKRPQSAPPEKSKVDNLLDSIFTNKIAKPSLTAIVPSYEKRRADNNELYKMINNEKLSKEQKMRELWSALRDPTFRFTDNQLLCNSNISDSNLFNKGFVEFLSFYGFKNNYERKFGFITSKRNKGLYSMNFTDVDNDKHINKVTTSRWCKGSPYYPKTFIVSNKDELNKLELNPDQKYFVKPRTGAGSMNIGVSYGKRMVFRPEIIDRFPLVFQENVKNMRLNEGRKEDERIYVIFVKINENIKVFLHTKAMVRMCKMKYTEEINKNNHFTINVDWADAIDKRCKDPCELDKIIPFVRDISRRVLPHISKKMLNGHKAEFWLTGWDVLFDKNNHPWLLEINSRPNQCENLKARVMHYPIFQQILEMIVALEKNEPFQLKDFLEIIL